MLKELTKSTADWDLSYGGLIINDEDWFGLHFGPETRTVIKDLGEFDWQPPFKIPVLEPRPLVEKDKKWEATVVTNNLNDPWARSGELAKVALGHTYLMHIKDQTADFYVLFRVEDFEQHKYCTITWQLVTPQEPPKP